jgi:hypothetical protein
MKQVVKALAVATVLMGGLSASASAHDSPVAWHDGGGYGWLSHNGGGTNIWQCDFQVDGHRVRQHAYTHRDSFIISSVWAPSGGCAADYIGISLSQFRSHRTCVEEEGCTGWATSGHSP